MRRGNLFARQKISSPPRLPVFLVLEAQKTKGAVPKHSAFAFAN
jgi:hypothetical protein